MAEPERLQKILARAGLGSRRRVEELIAAGRVRVNGETAVLGRRADPVKDKVEVDGSVVPVRPDLVHYLLNKPVGVVTTASDPEGRPTVIELVDPAARVWPVGRLDADTEGALVLTNDGELTQRLTHPRYGVSKTYVARVAGAGRAALQALSRGVTLEDGPARAQSVRALQQVPGGMLVELTVTEGRNRQVRRMFEAVGCRVQALARTGIGPLMLGRLKPGTFRKLSPAEVQALYSAAGSEAAAGTQGD